MRRALLAGFLICLTGQALACSCARPGPDAPQPEIIVNARVLTVTRVGTGIVARLRVLRAEKGRTPRTFDVHTAGHPVACGVEFQKGAVERYAIGRHDGRYTANSCMQFLMNYRRQPTIPAE